MYKKIISTFILLLSFFLGFAQNLVPNGNFEVWENIKIIFPSGGQTEYLQPLHWKIKKGNCFLISQTFSSNEDVFNGINSLMLLNIRNSIEPAIIESTFAMKKRHYHLSFWSKTKWYENKPFFVELFLFNKQGNIGQGRFEADDAYFSRNNGNQGAFHQSFIHLNYQNQEIPDSMTIRFISASTENYPNGGQLFIDSVSLSKHTLDGESYPEFVDQAFPTWSIAPNPVKSSKLHVLINDPFGHNSATIKLMNIYGNILFSKLIGLRKESSITLNIPQRSSGIYFLQLEVNGQISFKRFIYEN